LTPAAWPDLERLFTRGHRFPGCWCMYWRIKRRTFEEQYGEGNREALKALVESGVVPGILAHERNEAVGWCSVAPREDFPVLDRSPVLRRIDDTPVWSLTCFFIARELRGGGLFAPLAELAVDYARERGARVVEAYPALPASGDRSDASLYMGLYPSLLRLGFVEVARPSPRRAVLRRHLTADAT
jgi:GNAT superfamily N-acetyltransferase